MASRLLIALWLVLIPQTALALACPTPRLPAASAPVEARRQASELSREAQALYQRHQHAAAAVRYHRAYGLHPIAGYLYSAARAEHRGGETARAKRHYRCVLAIDAAAEDVRRRARGHLQTLQAAAARTKKLASERPPATPSGVPQGVSRGDALEPTNRRNARWIWAGSAGLGVLAGLSWAWAEWDWAELGSHRDSAGVYRGVSADEVESQRGSINRRVLAARWLIGVGLAGSAVGWWLWSRDSTPAPAASGDSHRAGSDGRAKGATFAGLSFGPSSVTMRLRF